MAHNQLFTAAKTHYHTLQVRVDAQTEIIDLSYRRLAKKYHPDYNSSLSAISEMQALNEAYSVLKDPESRRAYDFELATRAKRPINRFGDRYQNGAFVICLLILSVLLFRFANPPVLSIADSSSLIAPTLLADEAVADEVATGEAATDEVLALSSDVASTNALPDQHPSNSTDLSPRKEMPQSSVPDAGLSESVDRKVSTVGDVADLIASSATSTSRDDLPSDNFTISDDASSGVDSSDDASLNVDSSDDDSLNDDSLNDDSLNVDSSNDASNIVSSETNKLSLVLSDVESSTLDAKDEETIDEQVAISRTTFLTQTQIPKSTSTPYSTTAPTQIPTQIPTSTSTSYPTTAPTQIPTSIPTAIPVIQPTVQSAVVQSAVAKPAVAQPAVAQPAVAQPAVAQPTVAQPAVVQPAPIQAAAAQPQNPQGTFRLLNPVDGINGRKRQTFEWSTDIVLAPQQGFEVVFWRPDQDPMVSGFGLAPPTTGSSLSVNLDKLDVALGSLFEWGHYRWGVLLVETEPYNRIALLGTNGVPETRAFLFTNYKGDEGQSTAAQGSP